MMTVGKLAEAERILGKVVRADTVSQPNHLAGALLALGGLAHIRADLDLERRCLIKASDLQTADTGARLGIEANLAMLEPDRSLAARRRPRNTPGLWMTRSWPSYVTWQLPACSSGQEARR
jgi:hypothetical protein